MGETGLAEVLDRVDKIADVVRDGAAESERLGHLAPGCRRRVARGGLFRTFVPIELGGLGLTIPEGVRVFERVSALDASTGWTLTILCSGSLFARFCPEDTFATICRDPRALIAGSLNPVTAQAEPVDGGFLFSGRATYLSGSAHARFIMASALVMKDQAPVLADGAIQIRAGFFPIEKARSLDTWNVTGMRATGSTDYEFDGVMVATDWTFEPFRDRPAATSDPFAAIPLWAQLGGLAAVAVGAARNMIDRFVELAATKVPTGGNFTRMAERAPAQIAVGEAEGLYLAAHAVLKETIEATWARGVGRRPLRQRDVGQAAPRVGDGGASGRAGHRSPPRCRRHECRRARRRARSVLARHAHDDPAHHPVAGSLRDRRPRAPRPRSRQPRDLGMAMARVTWKVRHVRDDEFDAWTRLFRGYADFYNWPTTDDHQRQIWKWIHEDHSVEALVAVPVDDAGNETDRPAGLAHLREWVRPLRGVVCGYLDDLYVEPAVRGRGAVDALFAEMRRIASERGWAIIRWTTADDNYRARSFYDKVATRTTWITYDMTP